MTPEDTPNMTERTDRQAQIDPWASVEAELLKAIGHPHVTVADLPPDTFVARFFAARSADAALLRERDAQIASLTAFRDAVASALCVENPFGEINDAAIIEAADTTLSQLFEFSAELVTLRAERDAAQQELGELRHRLVEALAMGDGVTQDSQIVDAAETLHDSEMAAQQEIVRLKASVASMWASSPCECWPGHTCNACTIYNAALSSSPRPQEP